jgi:GT2 family glycosyltransferase
MLNQTVQAQRNMQINTQKPLVSVIIPTHNRSDALAQTLFGLAKQQFDQPWEVIVVNNRCTDDTDEVVQRQTFPVPLQLIHRKDIAGPAAARNAGAAVAAGDYLLFMDNDILVEPDFLKRHWSALSSHPGCWIVGQIVNLPEQERTPFGRFRRSLVPCDPPGQPVREAQGMTGQSLSLLRVDFEKLNGFDEGYDIASVEDIELAVRAWRAGIKILYVPDIIGLHNDWAGFSIRDYCQRQRTYTHCEPQFWKKYGKNYPKQELAFANLPVQWGTDSPRVLCGKLVKQFVALSPVQWLLFGTCDVLERWCPWKPLLWRLYRLLLAGAIYKGFREGLIKYDVKLEFTAHNGEGR